MFDACADLPVPLEPAGHQLSSRYVLEALLGRGGMADVYRARDLVLDRPVAVKVFRAGVVPGTLEPVRQRSEMRVLAGLTHPNLVALWDGGEDGRLYLVMELVDGPTLAQRISSGPLSETEVADLGAQLADALDHVHQRRIVHRDVKPANVLLASTGAGSQVKLADFGIARLVDGTRFTEDGTTIGTPHYLSPEQVAGRPVGTAADVYALGLILLECLTGRRSYEGTAIECALARLTTPPAVPDSLPGQWRSLLTRMTVTDPAARPSAEEVATVLRAIADGDADVVPFDILPFEAVPFDAVPSPVRRRRVVGRRARPDCPSTPAAGARRGCGRRRGRRRRRRDHRCRAARPRWHLRAGSAAGGPPGGAAVRHRPGR